LSDFTELKGLVVTIQGKVLKHLLYHFRVIYSGWREVGQKIRTKILKS